MKIIVKFNPCRILSFKKFHQKCIDSTNNFYQSYFLLPKNQQYFPCLAGKLPLCCLCKINHFLMECSNFFNAHINKVFKIHLSKIGNVFKSCVNDASYAQLRKLLDNNKRCSKLARPEKANIFTTQSLRHSWQLDHKKIRKCLNVC